MRLLLLSSVLSTQLSYAMIGFHHIPILNIKREEVSLEKDLIHWEKQIIESRGRFMESQTQATPPLPSYGECSPIKEATRTLVCLFVTPQDLNDTFTRLSIFSEGGSQLDRGMILDLEDPSVTLSKQLNLGHNLKTSVIKVFFDNLKDKEETLHRSELALKNSFLDSEEMEKYDYVIALSIKSRIPYFTVLTHELSHALYGTDKNYKDAIQSCWNSQSSETKTHYTDLLSSKYNQSYTEVIVDEWQAHSLQNSPLSGYIEAREKIIQCLKKNNVKIPFYL